MDDSDGGSLRYLHASYRYERQVRQWLFGRRWAHARASHSVIATSIGSKAASRGCKTRDQRALFGNGDSGVAIESIWYSAWGTYLHVVVEGQAPFYLAGKQTPAILNDLLLAQVTSYRWGWAGYPSLSYTTRRWGWGAVTNRVIWKWRPWNEADTPVNLSSH